MKINLKQADSNETVCASIRMNRKTYDALRAYMHAKEGQPVAFPYGVILNKRGFGWYRLSPNSRTRGIEKMAFAIKVLKMFMKEEEEKVEAEIARLMPLMYDPNLKVASFSTAHGPGEWGYLGATQITNKVPDKSLDPRPLDPNRIHSLLNKFAPVNKRKGAR